MHLPRGLPVLVYALYRWERVKAIRTATIWSLPPTPITPTRSVPIPQLARSGILPMLLLQQ